MMRRLGHVIIFILICESGVGQNPGYLIRNFDFSEIMPELSPVYCMVEDTLGMLFFGGGESLVYFDGTEWHTSRFNSGVIYSLFRDSKGDLWYGAVHDFGRIKRSEQSGFILESLAYLVPDSIRLFGNIVNILEYDSTCFFHSSTHIFGINGDKIKVFSNNSNYPKGFVAGNNYIVNQNISGFLKYQSGQFTPLPGGEFYKDKIVVGAVSLSSDSILIGTRTNGVFLFNQINGKSSVWLNGDSPIVELLKKTRLQHFISTPEGKLAFSTSDMGTLVTDRRGTIIRRFNNSSGTQDNRHNYSYVTQTNYFWMCTSRGASWYNVNSPFYIWGPDEGIPGVIDAIATYGHSVLAGTLNGLYIINDPLNPKGTIEQLLNIPTWGISAATLDNSEEVLFLSTQDGLYLLRDHTPELLFSGNTYKTIQLNSNKNIFISVGISGLHAFSMVNGKIKEYQLLKYLFSDASTVVQDNRDIWITYSYVGKLFQISQQEIIERLLSGELDKLTYNEISTDSPITGFNIDSDNFVFSSVNGFMEFDSLTNSLRRLKTWGQDVAGYRKKVSSMSMDSKGNIWLGGNNILLNRYDGTYSVYKMNFEDISNNFSLSLVHHDNSGRTWIGDSRGVMLIDSIITPRYDIPPVIITRVLQKDTLIHHIYTNNCLNNSDQTVVFKEGGEISIHYSLPFYGDNSGIKYSYRLDGYHNNWSNWNSEKHIFFHELKSGKYTFQIKAKLENGSETAPSYFNFKINRHWYETFLFKIIVLLVLLSIVRKFVRINLRKKTGLEIDSEEITEQRVRDQFMLKLIEKSPAFSDTSSAANRAGVDIPESTGANRQDKFIEELTSLVEKHISDSDLSIEKLSGMMNMSHKTLYRRVKSYAGMPTIMFIRKIRLKNAAVLLANTDLSMAEIAYRVGFKDPSYFTKSFGEEFGKTPMQFQKELEKIKKRKSET